MGKSRRNRMVPTTLPAYLFMLNHRLFIKHLGCNSHEDNYETWSILSEIWIRDLKFGFFFFFLSWLIKIKFTGNTSYKQYLQIKSRREIYRMWTKCLSNRHGIRVIFTPDKGKRRKSQASLRPLGGAADWCWPLKECQKISKVNACM